MPKSRQQKEAILAQTAERIIKASSIVFVTVSGVKVGELEGIRGDLFSKGLQLQVAKNSICKRALEQAGIEVPSELLDQPIGMVFSYDDVVAPAKSIAAFAKDIEALHIAGGVMDKAFLSTAQVEKLAKLPSREQLLGQLVGTLAAPLSGLVNVLQGNIRGLVTVMGQIRDAKV